MQEAELGKWLDALKSGRYQQFQSMLYCRTETGVRYCCLGVLSDMRNDYQFGALAYPIEESLGQDPYAGLAICLNDSGPIDQYARVIADIELAPEDWITEGTPKSQESVSGSPTL